jgi:predicted amidohydrolase
MKYRLALCQIRPSKDKASAYAVAEEAAVRAAELRADVVCLPEMWNCPYSNRSFREFAEGEDGESVAFMSRLARDMGAVLIGGSIPELAEGRVYNSSYIFSESGRLIGKHRKIHLFDVDIAGGQRFMESETLSPGGGMTVVDSSFGRIGVAICYDVRFPGLFSAMADAGAELIALPAAFSMSTGPAHWDLLMSARALDNQVYFAACSPARDLDAPYQAYGHSCIVSPWGEFCAKADFREAVICAEIDRKYLEEVRAQLPLRKQRRAF